MRVCPADRAPGTGKTLLCHCLGEIGRRVTSVFLTKAISPAEPTYFQAILYDLSLPYAGRTEQEMSSRSPISCSTTTPPPTHGAADRRGPSICWRCARGLRLLGNLDHGMAGPSMSCWSAQPSFLVTLRRPELASRISVGCSRRSRSLAVQERRLLLHISGSGCAPEQVIHGEEALEILARARRECLCSTSRPSAFLLATPARRTRSMSGHAGGTSRPWDSKPGDDSEATESIPRAGSWSLGGVESCWARAISRRTG